MINAIIYNSFLHLFKKNFEMIKVSENKKCRKKELFPAVS